MRRVAFHTLGCKVNQYDTQAMLESFQAAGWQVCEFDERADAYVVNTCTVTGTGDKKSVQIIRRVHRENPEAAIVVAGCLAQRDPDRVALPGVRLVLGTAKRAKVVELLEKAIDENVCLIEVNSLKGAEFEPLTVNSHEGKTRATMKIQEGCDRYCTYCVIPYVRGPVRSMALGDVAAEAERLAGAGYREIVVTGIHLTSYGRGTDYELCDALDAVGRVEGVKRIRLGSLEPYYVNEERAKRLSEMPKLLPPVPPVHAVGQRRRVEKNAPPLHVRGIRACGRAAKKIYARMRDNHRRADRLPGRNRRRGRRDAGVCGADCVCAHTRIPVFAPQRHRGRQTARSGT